MKTLVTGATGFVGQAFCETASRRGYAVRCVSRRPEPSDGSNDTVLIDSIDGRTNWRTALTGCNIVVHLAARVHVMKDTAIDPLQAFRVVNTEGTLNLARQAADAGVRRFIFVSSVKVNGESTLLGQPFTARDAAKPQDAYGISKAEAEDGLRRLADIMGMEVVIVRPPLVYGPGVKGNFHSIMRWLAQGLPLPLGSITDNRRSFVGLSNLVDMILTCAKHPAAAGHTFLVSDGEDLSTAELLRRLSVALGRPAHLWPFPSRFLRRGAFLLGKTAAMERLTGSLQVDIKETCETLGWQPFVSVDEGLRAAAASLNY